MAIRTTSAAVRALLVNGGNYDTENEPSLTPAIETGSSIVDDLVTNAAADGVTIAAAKAELIERWLSAWAHCMMDRPYASRNELGAGGTFVGQTGKGLESNSYGQTAKALDPTGGWLVALVDGAIAGLTWMGKTADTQLTYEERNGGG